MTPDCMTPDELRAWHEANATSLTPAMTPCWDCPVEWSVAMRDIGRCNGTPGEPLRPPRQPRGRRERNRLAAQRWRERQKGVAA